MDANIETEQQRVKEVEQQLSSLIEKARGLIIAQLAPLSDAIENAEKLVVDAHTLARQFNLNEAHTVCFNEDLELTFGNLKKKWWIDFLTPEAVRIHGQTAPQPGVRLELLPDVIMKDYPQRATVAIPRPKALRLIAEHRGTRV